MLAALSGTPGTGKTSVSEVLKGRGHGIVSLEELAEEHGCVAGVAEERDSKEIDLDKLDVFVKENIKDRDLIIEGHLSHFLSVDMAIILRCDPLVLKERLTGKGWIEGKVNENVKAEILDIIKVEAHEALDQVWEIDTTQKSIQETADDIELILKGAYESPHVDWLERYEYLLFE